MNIHLLHRFARQISLFLACLITIPALSQEPATCAEKLQAAQTLFERGQVEQVPDLLAGCLQSGFNREESLMAFKLLIQAYLFNEKLELADSAMIAFLKKNPEYKVSPTDHSSFVSLFNNFASKVIIQVSLKGGLNLPFLFITSSNPVMGIPGENKYSSNAAFSFGAIEVKYKLTERLEVNAEAGFSQLSFRNAETILTDNSLVIGRSNFEEVHRRIEVPVTLTYEALRFGKFTPYARAGLGPSFNLNSYGTGEYKPADKGIPSHEGENIRNLNRRFVDLFIQAGAGLKFKVREGFLFAEMRSNFGILEQSGFDGFTGEMIKSFDYLSGESYFRLNNLNFNFGYTRIFYKPVRREE